MFSRASGFVINGGVFTSIRGVDLLVEQVATDAMHNSNELYDPPKCHPHTRIAVLDDIMKWVIESEVQDEFIMWLFGPAGAGKSAIAQKIAELAAEKGLLIGSFFFSRTSYTRNSNSRLIPTLACQMAVSIPCTRTHIEDAIERDPAIFKRNIQTQIDTLLVKPFQLASTKGIPFPKLLIIDGLDECTDSQVQVAILDAISRSLTKHNLSIICLVASRPEKNIISSFNDNELLKSIHRRLALDNNYHPDDDIRLFFSDKFKEIQCTHRLRSTIPLPWPSEEALDTLVKKSSGQFIFAATVVRFVESNRHRPSERLNIILNILPPGTTNPFTELDGVYKQLLSSVDDIQLTLHVLSLYASSPNFADILGYIRVSEHFLSLEEGNTINHALIDLPSLVSYDELSGEVKILHASFVDFLSDKRRSNEFYIDMAHASANFACRTLQYVKGPNGIGAGDVHVFTAGITGVSWILNSRLRSEILNFDIDAFIKAAITSPYSPRSDAISTIFSFWMFFISKLNLEDEDEELLIHRYRNSFESRIQKYQFDWRLQLLLTLAYVMEYSPSENDLDVPDRRCLDILLEMDDHALHLVDQDALDLRYSSRLFGLFTDRLNDITSRYVNGDKYASAALHCMRFLSNPPEYSETGNNGSPEIAVTYAEWRATCYMALEMLCELLERANTSPEIIQFMTDHDINATVQKNLPVSILWWVNMHILAFLSRGGVSVNWRIISAIQRALSTSNPLEQSESSEGTHSDMYETAEENDSDMYETDSDM